jgi:hypothetical protein
MNSFFDFLKNIGFDEKQTRIEKYRLDGTSNYLISLNHSGVTWAIAIRIPAMGSDQARFEKEKILAVDTASFLVEHFSQGVPLSDNVDFRFNGSSSLIPFESIHEFFSFQNNLPSLVEVDSITGNETKKTVSSQAYPEGINNVKNIDQVKKDQVRDYLSSYKGNYFVSKGAPASETLDDYFDLVFDVAHALFVLHSHTGLSSIIPIEQVLELASDFDEQLNQMVNDINFSPETAVYESYIKHQKKRNPDDNQHISFLIKKELLLRTKPGKELLEKLIHTLEQSMTDKSAYCCFTHNDPHCENFVIVKHLYSVVKNNHQYIDREFINDILSSLDSEKKGNYYTIEYNQKDNKLLYREYDKTDEDNCKVNIIKPDLQYDIHLIDIDEATGIDSRSQKLYLYDLLIYALSVQNISAIKGETINRDDVVKAYYDFYSHDIAN